MSVELSRRNWSHRQAQLQREPPSAVDHQFELEERGEWLWFASGRAAVACSLKYFSKRAHLRTRTALCEPVNGSPDGHSDWIGNRQRGLTALLLQNSAPAFPRLKSSGPRPAQLRTTASRSRAITTRSMLARQLRRSDTNFQGRRCRFLQASCRRYWWLLERHV